MASHFAILSAFLLFTSSIPGTPNPSTFVQPPPGISLTVLSFDTNSCFQSTPNVTFIEQGNELSIGYANFGAWTTPGQGAYDKMCSITLQVSYPTGYQFYVHDPDFQGNSTAEDQGAAFFTAYSYFGSNIILAQAVSV
jgi:hypothetical protein